jgi:hypothetical protein
MMFARVSLAILVVAFGVSGLVQMRRNPSHQPSPPMLLVWGVLLGALLVVNLIPT